MKGAAFSSKNPDSWICIFFGSNSCTTTSTFRLRTYSFHVSIDYHASFPLSHASYLSLTSCSSMVRTYAVSTSSSSPSSCSSRWWTHRSIRSSWTRETSTCRANSLGNLLCFIILDSLSANLPSPAVVVPRKPALIVALSSRQTLCDGRWCILHGPIHERQRSKHGLREIVKDRMGTAVFRGSNPTEGGTGGWNAIPGSNRGCFPFRTWVEPEA